MQSKPQAEMAMNRKDFIMIDCKARLRLTYSSSACLAFIAPAVSIKLASGPAILFTAIWLRISQTSHRSDLTSSSAMGNF